LNLSASNMSVKSDNQVKYLGLIFDSNLNWKPYYTNWARRFQEVLEYYLKLDYYVKHLIITMHSTFHEDVYFIFGFTSPAELKKN